ncbi:MAG: class I SAM-dependent methyltransferase [Candidatus Nitrohelix vancouverensis]|uniref:Class I SAM-dependent methyltransferase n=1 Tax=Candidatus Nitrohelix vancouverensis TaxID=2705534 RepID=A0A7T0C0X0_9BACT|nr:MAG: class I SAM-dependent methyltransferase [Candidatus Nitrohelix vancouverensis]
MANKEHNRFLYYWVARPIWIAIGRLLYKSAAWQHIRRNCFNFPGKNVHVEIKKISKILFHLNAAYYEYFEFRKRHLSQREWQKAHWDDYGETGYKMLDEPRLGDDFLTMMDDMARRTERVIEIGCGGFGRTRELAKRYAEKEFFGFDISEVAQDIYDKEVKTLYPNIRFQKGDIFDHIQELETSPFFYTYLTLMHFDEAGLNDFFAKLAGIEKPVRGIVREPTPKEGLSKNYKSRDYKHNYPVYFEKYGFMLIDSSLSENGETGTFYFVTKSDS